MKVVKTIISFPFKMISIFLDGLYYVCSFAAKGFFYYISLIFKLIGKILPFKFIKKIENNLNVKMTQPESFVLLLIYCFVFIVFYNILYIDDSEVVSNVKFIEEQLLVKDDENHTNVEDTRVELSSDEINLFRKYSKLSLNDVNISDLKSINDDTVSWISVDGTNINYPIVQTEDNDFYLSHTYDKSFRMTGWTFMDYRNDPNMNDDNTIFYGHNLLNETSFGSVSKIFSNSWLNNSNKSVVIITENKKFVYRIFSAYYTEPNIDYLITNFYSKNEKEKFLEGIKNKSIINLDNSDVNADSKIITLSTCTDDNKGRKVVHAVLTQEF